PSQSVYIVKADGETLEGKTRLVVSTSRGIKTISVVLPSGELAKFTASEIQEVGFRNNALTRAQSTNDQASSLKKILKADWNQIYKQEYIVYSRVILPSGKPVLMQQLNPGFDTRIKVYYSLGSRKTSGIGIPLANAGPIAPASIKLTGGRQRAYWVSKDDGKVFKLRRGNYNKKNFKSLFGDSAGMDAIRRPYRFKQFPAHVFFYDEIQKRK
ncbi:MAG TPA: hypothetical protein VEB86_04575, partial [Chryseosolibacter sp.]|nr:hypothetical protein [Chryseosolibacter sp.]